VEEECTASLQRRKWRLKAKFEGGSSYYSVKRRVPGAFNVGLIGSTCTALPRRGTRCPPWCSDAS